MITPKVLTLFGLWATLAGAALLFFFGLPHKKIGNTIVFGPMFLDLGNGADDETRRQIDAYSNRVTRLNRLGFALVALGTLLQIIGQYATTD